MRGLVCLPLCPGGGVGVSSRAGCIGLFRLFLLLSGLGCCGISRGTRGSLRAGWCLLRLLARLLLLSSCPQSPSTRLCIRTYGVQDFWPLAQKAPSLGKPEAALLS